MPDLVRKPSVICPQRGVRFDLTEAGGSTTLTYDLLQWQQDCFEQQYGSPVLCSCVKGPLKLSGHDDGENPL